MTKEARPLSDVERLAALKSENDLLEEFGEELLQLEADEEDWEEQCFGELSENDDDLSEMLVGKQVLHLSDKSHGDVEAVLPAASVSRLSNFHLKKPTREAVLKKYVHPSTGCLATFSDSKEREETFKRRSLKKYIEERKDERSSIEEQVKRHTEAYKTNASYAEKIAVDIKNMEGQLAEMEKPRDTVSLDSQILTRKRNELQSGINACKLQYTEAMGNAQFELKAMEAAEVRLCEANTGFLELDAYNQKLEEQEIMEQAEQEIIGNFRAIKEEAAAQKLEKQRIHRREKIAQLQQQQHSRLKKAMKVAVRGQEAAVERLNNSLRALKEEEQETKRRLETERQKKMKSIVNLKKGIDASQQQLRAKLEKSLKRREELEEQEREERIAILKQGQNPEEIFRRKKQEETIEKETKKFQATQALRQMEIVNKIIREQENAINQERVLGMGKNWKPKAFSSSYSLSSANAGQRKSYTKSDNSSSVGEESDDLPLYLAETTGNFLYDPYKSSPIARPKTPMQATSSNNLILSDDDGDGDDPRVLRFGTNDTNDDDLNDLEGSSNSMNLSGKDHDFSDDDESNDDEFKEYSGIWNENRVLHKLPNIGMSDASLSKAKAKQIDTIVSKIGPPPGAQPPLKNVAARKQQQQVVAGRVFKGDLFKCNRDEIVFKDFDVGETYVQTITLTNVSYCISAFKVKDLPLRLVDILQLEYKHPGKLSPGLTCDITLRFTPRVAEDIEDRIEFATETGSMFVPIKCLVQKCEIRLSENHVKFEPVYLGERSTCSITIYNDGALATNFVLIAGDKNIRLPDEVSSTSSSATETVSLVKIPNINVTTQSSSLTEQKILNDDEDGVSRECDGSREGEESDCESDNGGKYSSVPGTELNTKTQSIVSSAEFENSIKCRCQTGRIEGYSFKKVTFMFHPHLVGELEVEYILHFDQKIEDVSFVVSGISTGVPIYLEQDVLDMKYCYFDLLYRDTLTVYNRGKSARKIIIDVPSEIKGDFEIIPKSVVVLANASFAFQIRFVPTKRLLESAKDYFVDLQTLELNMKIEVQVPSQVRAVYFTLKAFLSHADIVFDPPKIDFGTCTTYESAKIPISIYNRSNQAQKVGFMNLPDCIDIYPGNGFMHLLPNEKITRDFIFSPSSANIYKFNLKCSTILNREYLLPATGVGIEPPLRLSSTTIKFKPTAFGDQSITSVYIENADTVSHAYEFAIPPDSPINISPVVALVAPKERIRLLVALAPKHPMFQSNFSTLKTISTSSMPCGGVAPTDAKLQASVSSLNSMDSSRPENASPTNKRHSPEKSRGNTATQRSSSRSPAKNSREGKKRKDLASAASNAGSVTGSNADPMNSSGNNTGGNNNSDTGYVNNNSQSPDIGAKFSEQALDEYANSNEDQDLAKTQERINQLREIEPVIKQFKIPCFVQDAVEEKDPHMVSINQLHSDRGKYSLSNMLYLEVHSVMVRPSLVISNRNGSPILDFGHVPVKAKKSMSIKIMNISNETLHLSSSLLPNAGVFEMVNSLRSLKPNEQHKIVFSFQPTDDSEFYEVMTVSSQVDNIHLKLRGFGVHPKVIVSPDNEMLDMGNSVIGDTVTREISITNTSDFAVQFTAVMHSTLAYSEQDPSLRFNGGNTVIECDPDTGLPTSTMPPKAACNLGINIPFDIIPTEGVIGRKETKQLQICFSPDQESPAYHDVVILQIEGEPSSHPIPVSGRAWPHLLFVTGGDYNISEIHRNTPRALIAKEELINATSGSVQGAGGSMGASDQAKSSERAPIILTFKCQHQKGEQKVVRRMLQIGNMKASQQSGEAASKEGTGGKKGSAFGEYQFEGFTSAAQAAGFSVETAKKSIESNCPLIEIPVTWQPHQDFSPGHYVSFDMTLIVKGDGIEQRFPVLLQGSVII
eukprot:Nk52_evm8s158 gene=Nk52_evmTU8s158